MHRLLLPLLAALLLASCTDDRVPLSYGLQEGRRLDYRLTLRADIERTLSGETRRERVHATFRAAQEIVELLPDGGARARMSLVPETLEVNGRAAAAGEGQEFVVELGSDGRVVAIEETAGDPAEPLETVGIERLLPRLRPVLPGADVRLGDTWRSETDFDDRQGRFSVATTSELDALGRIDGRDAALVRTTYVTPVDRREELPNAVADVAGEDVGAQAAWFSLDGFLIRSSGDSLGRYRVSFHPPEDQPEASPVEGELVVRLETEMRLV